MPSLVLFRQLLRARIVTWCIWVIIWSLLLLLFSYVFNSLNANADASDATFRQLPSGVFSAFNIDPLNYLTRIENFLSGQFLFVYSLAGSVFAFSLGVGAIGRKIENRTISGLLTKALPRGSVYITSLLANLLVLLSASGAIGLYAWAVFHAVLTHQTRFSGSYFFWLFAGTGLLFCVFCAFGQLIGMLQGGGKAVQLGAGIIVISWFVSSLGDIANLPSWLQALSLFHYFDVSQLRDHFSFNWHRGMWLPIVTLVFTLVGWQLFKRKDLPM